MFVTRACAPTALVLLALAFPTAAGAAQITTGGFLDVFFTAAPGEANDVVVDYPGNTTVITDQGAPLTAGPGADCVQVDEHQVRCSPARVQVTASLGDRDDTVVALAGFTTELRGEDGDDHISGGTGHDVIDGGAGADAINANSGDDEIRGGPGADTLEGGDGEDTVLYDGPAPVSATLDGGRNDGEAGENDLIRSDVEDLTGGLGSDLLVGNERDNRLDGGGGPDQLNGGDGNDELSDGSAGNVFDGGAGNDEITSRRIFESDESGFESLVPGRDDVACGFGVDDLIGDVLDVTADDCESVDTGITVRDRSMESTRDARALARVHCGRPKTCRFRIRLRRDGYLTPLTAARVPAGATRNVRLRLNSTGAKLLRRRRRLRVDVVVYADPGVVTPVTLSAGELSR
jgi:Ca2+-binding RTX toxin-like protein